MNNTQKKIENAAIGVVILDDLKKIVAFRKPGVAAAIWRRQMPEGFQTWIDDLPSKKLPSARVLTEVKTVRDTVMAICNSVHMPYSLNRRLLIDDVAALAQQFAGLMEVDVLRIRFDVVEDNACSKFHIDAVTARLVCTYRGPGTQYGISANGGEPSRVFSVPTGSPVLLRGTKWPEPPASGLLHRSPPIEGSGTSRLMVVIDPIFEEQNA